MDMDSVGLQFDYQYWVYSTEFLSLDYRIGGGSWVHLQNLASQGGYTLINDYNVDISITQDNPAVQLRWRYYNLSNGCDWWVNIDDVQVSGVTNSVPEPTTMLLLGLGLMGLAGVRSKLKN